MIDISDFPFPQDCKTESVKDERFQTIVAERTSLFASVSNKKNDEITKFVQTRANIKIVYNTANKSLLKHAVDLHNFEIYFYFKSQGFQATEFSDLKDILNDDEMKEALKQRVRQRKKNVDDAISNHDEFINTLCNKSFIHNRKLSRQNEIKFHQKIRKWFEDINKIMYGSELIRITASCDALKIIFDFESFTVSYP